MIREKRKVSTQTRQWKCVESRADSKCLYYGRFTLSPLMKGQAETIGITMRRILLGEMEATCITRAKSQKILNVNEYSTVIGIEESIHEILMNLKEIVLKSNLYGTQEASICFKGPGYVTAQDIILPPSVEVIDNTQPIANLYEPINLCIELQIERTRGYHIKTINNMQDGSFTLDPVFMPVIHANYSIHSYVIGIEKKEILFLEIWTNGSLTPKQALYEASRNLIDLFLPFLDAEEENFVFVGEEGLDPVYPIFEFENNQHNMTLPLFTFHHNDTFLRNKEREITLTSVFIDQLELPTRTYNCLKKSNIHTVWELLNKSAEDLMKIEDFRVQDLKNIFIILKKFPSKIILGLGTFE